MDVNIPESQDRPEAAEEIDAISSKESLLQSTTADDQANENEDDTIAAPINVMHPLPPPLVATVHPHQPQRLQENVAYTGNRSVSS